jgi:hypothetical protein
MTKEQLDHIKHKLDESDEGPWFVTTGELERVIAAIESERKFTSDSQQTNPPYDQKTNREHTEQTHK